MRRIPLLILLFFAAGVNLGVGAGGKNGLRGLVLILDPGHGGKDPGASGVFRGQRVVEDEYVYDIAKRVELFAKERGAVVHKTVVDPHCDRYRNWPAQQVFPDEHNEVFTAAGKMAAAGTAGLNRRVAFANAVLKRYSRQRQSVVFLSIHFDVLGTGKEGVHIILPEGLRSQVADKLIASFNELSAEIPAKVSGHGVKRVFVLGRCNGIREKVLVELGNFNNEADNWRIRNYQTRNRYAFRMIAGLERFMESR